MLPKYSSESNLSLSFLSQKMSNFISGVGEHGAETLAQDAWVYRAGAKVCGHGGGRRSWASDGGS